MRRRVDAARAAAHHRDPDIRELIAELARRLDAVMRRLPRPDERDAVLILRQQRALHIEHDGRIVNFAEQWRILRVLLCENTAAEILRALQLRGEVDGILPTGNGRGRFLADAMHGKKLLFRCAQDRRRLTEALQKLAHAHGTHALDQVQRHEGFP